MTTTPATAELDAERDTGSAEARREAARLVKAAADAKTVRHGQHAADLLARHARHTTADGAEHAAALATLADLLTRLVRALNGHLSARRAQAWLDPDAAA